MRKTFTTTIEETIQEAFKKKCVSDKVKMNDVLEVFMKNYAEGDYQLETELRLKKK